MTANANHLAAVPDPEPTPEEAALTTIHARIQSIDEQIEGLTDERTRLEAAAIRATGGTTRELPDGRKLKITGGAIQIDSVELAKTYPFEKYPGLYTTADPKINVKAARDELGNNTVEKFEKGRTRLSVKAE